MVAGAPQMRMPRYCRASVSTSAEAGARRRRGAQIVGTVVLAIVANFWFIYPILTDQLMTRTMWSARMWFPSWI